MRVLQINTRYYNGGSTGRITFDLKKVMEANGIESYVAFVLAIIQRMMKRELFIG